MGQTLINVLSNAPMVLVCLVGLILAIVQWNRTPAAALWLGLGSGGLAASTVLQPIVYAVLGRMTVEMEVSQIGVMYGIVGFVFNLGQAALMAAFIAAVLSDRAAGQKSATPYTS